MADIDLGNLAIFLRARFDQLDNDLKQARAATDRASKDMQGHMERVEKNTEKTAQAMEGFGHVAHVVAGIITGELVVRFLALAKEIEDTSRQIGISVERLQEYRVAADIAGAGSEAVTRSLQFFSRNLGDTTEGVTPFRIALGQLGIRFEELRRIPFDEALGRVSDALSRVTDTTVRNNLAMEIFQRTGIRAINFLSLSRTETARLQQEAHRLGLVLGHDVIENAAKAKDELELFETGLRVTATRIAAELLPVLRNLKELFADPQFQNNIASVAGQIRGLISWIADHKQAILAVVGALAGMWAGRFFGQVGAATGAVIGGLEGWRSGATETATAMEQLEQRSLAVSESLNVWRSRLQGFEQRGVDTAEARQQVRALEQELETLNNQMNNLRNPASTRVTVTPSGSTGPASPFFPQIDEQIKQLRVKRGVLLDEFHGFSEGFADALQSMKLPGVNVMDVLSRGAGQLTGQLRDLNVEQGRFRAAQIEIEVQTPYERANREINRMNSLLEIGALNQDTFNRKVMQLRFPQLTQAINELSNFNGLVDQAVVGSLNKTADALADITVHTKSFKEGMADLAKNVIRDLIQMTYRMALFKAVSAGLNAFGIFGGGTGGMPVGRVGVGHTGGTVGMTAMASRNVWPGIFLGAPRMHSGGIVGLRSDERPIIAQVGEVVMPRGAGGGMPAIHIHPAAAGETFDVRKESDGSIAVVGRMVQDALSDYDRRLPHRVRGLLSDPRGR